MAWPGKHELGLLHACETADFTGPKRYCNKVSLQTIYLSYASTGTGTCGWKQPAFHSHYVGQDVGQIIYCDLCHFMARYIESSDYIIESLPELNPVTIMY